MAAKLKAGSGKKLDDSLNKAIQKELQQFSKEMAKTFQDQIDASTDGLRTEFGSVISSLAGSIITGKFDARSFSNGVAKAFAPAITDFLNKSLSQQGDDLLGSIAQAQRNS